MGPAQVKSGLAEMARRLGAGRRASDRAVDAAYAAQRAFQELLLDAGRRALETLGEMEAALKMIPAKTELLSVEGAGHDLGFKGKSMPAEVVGGVVRAFANLFELDCEG